MALAEKISDGLARSVRVEVTELNRRIAKLDVERQNLVGRRDMLLTQRLRAFRMGDSSHEVDGFDRLLGSLHEASH
jgi:hypothetical protein